MAKAGIVYVGSDDGLVTYSDPGGIGRWRRVGHELHGHAITAIATKGALIIRVAATGLGVQRSNDGGQGWQPAPDCDAPSAANPSLVATTSGLVQLANPRLRGATAFARLAGRHPVLLGAGAGGTMLFRSEDDGIHWQAAEVKIEALGRVSVIVPASYHMDIAWAGTEIGQLLRSDDRGRSWELVAQEPVAIRSLAVVRLA
jgi:photosystem II stability/assembly factor-like uncharacterized protein